MTEHIVLELFTINFCWNIIQFVFRTIFVTICPTRRNPRRDSFCRERRRKDLHELRVGQPVLHARDPAFDGALIAVAAGDHPLQHGNVGRQVLLNGRLVQSEKV